MEKEMSSWMFVINALYWVKDEGPLSLDMNTLGKTCFWLYVFFASEKFKKELKNCCLCVSADSIKKVLQNDFGTIIKDHELYISPEIDKPAIERINNWIDPDIREKFPQIFTEAYEEARQKSSDEQFFERLN